MGGIRIGKERVRNFWERKRLGCGRVLYSPRISPAGNWNSDRASGVAASSWHVGSASAGIECEREGFLGPRHCNFYKKRDSSRSRGDRWKTLGSFRVLIEARLAL